MCDDGRDVTTSETHTVMVHYSCERWGWLFKGSFRSDSMLVVPVSLTSDPVAPDEHPQILTLTHKPATPPLCATEKKNK